MFNKTKSSKPAVKGVPAERRAPEEPVAQSDALAAARPSVISEGMVVTGEVLCPGALHLQGSIEGQVKAAQVTIGRPGQLTGELRAESVTLSGLFEGELYCDELSVAHTATLRGRVVCGSVKLQSGAVLEGDIKVPSAT